jgi:hypothetical protein
LNTWLLLAVAQVEQLVAAAVAQVDLEQEQDYL